MSYLKNSSSRFGDTSLQEKINGDNYSILNFYLEQFKDKFPDASKLKDVLRILVNHRNACLMKPCHLFSLLFSSHPPLLPSNYFLTSLISSLSPLSRSSTTPPSLPVLSCLVPSSLLGRLESIFFVDI